MVLPLIDLIVCLYLKLPILAIEIYATSLEFLLAVLFVNHEVRIQFMHADRFIFKEVREVPCGRSSSTFWEICRYARK